MVYGKVSQLEGEHKKNNILALGYKEKKNMGYFNTLRAVIKHTSFVNRLVKNVTDYVLMSEGIIRDSVDFRIGTDIIYSHMPLTVIIRNAVHEEKSKDEVVIREPHKAVRNE
jgi:hypothetical protein